MRICLTVIFLIGFLSGEAQWRLGLKAGLNSSNLVHRWNRHESRITGDAISRINGGLQVEIPMDEQWYFHSGLNYSGKGANLFETYPSMKKDSQRVRLHYLELPLMVVYKFPSENEHQFLLSSGPYIGYGFDGTIAWKRGFIPVKRHIHRDEEEEYRRFELGWMISALYEINSRYGLRLDFSKSLLNIHQPEVVQRNRVLGISVYWYLR